MRGLRLASAAGLTLSGLLLTACAAAAAQPAGASPGGTPASAAPGGTGDCNSVATCYTPQQIQVASGGGFSRLFGKPAYQDGIPGIGVMRGVPDVSADANGHTGMAIAIAQPSGTYIRNSGGTSASAPIWAGLIALADQYAHRPLGFVNPALYRIAASPAAQRAFHDITSGTNTATFPPRTFTGYRAAPGWDPVTGLGSPDAQVLVPLLARFAQQQPTMPNG